MSCSRSTCTGNSNIRSRIRAPCIFDMSSHNTCISIDNFWSNIWAEYCQLVFQLFNCFPDIIYLILCVVFIQSVLLSIYSYLISVLVWFTSLESISASFFCPARPFTCRVFEDVHQFSVTFDFLSWNVCLIDGSWSGFCLFPTLLCFQLPDIFRICVTKSSSSFISPCHLSCSLSLFSFFLARCLSNVSANRTSHFGCSGRALLLSASEVSSLLSPLSWVPFSSDVNFNSISFKHGGLMGLGPCECGSIDVSTVNSLGVEGLTFVCSTSSVCLEVTIDLLVCNAVLFIYSLIDGVENVNLKLWSTSASSRCKSSSWCSSFISQDGGQPFQQGLHSNSSLCLSKTLIPFWWHFSQNCCSISVWHTFAPIVNLFL